jgi:methylated-DNA-[protein]-cysteine S-methyltransferase
LLPSTSGRGRLQLRALNVDSPVGPLSIYEREGLIIALRFGPAPDAAGDNAPVLRQAARYLDRYFAGRREPCTLPLAPAGSRFQQQVWQLMLAIPYGQTATYGEFAGRLNSAARAVGQACGANPIPILIPCHRVLGSGGRLGGFSGGTGLPTKMDLLRREGALL